MSRLIRLLAVAVVATVGLAVPTTVGAAPAPPQITTTSLPSVIQGTTYPATQLKVTGGSWPYTWSVVAGALPYGLKLSTGGRLSGATGYPYSAPIPITVQVKDGKGVTAVRDFEIVVKRFEITTPALKNGKRGQFYYVPLKTNGGCIEGRRMQWGIDEPSGALPPGLKISPRGVISGIPKSSGIWSVTAYAECPVFNNGVAGKVYTLTVT